MAAIFLSVLEQSVQAGNPTGGGVELMKVGHKAQ